MGKVGQLQTKLPDVDNWCVKHIRKISGCFLCLHYFECLGKGESVAPSAIEHKYANSVLPKSHWDDLLLNDDED